jgi:hypothetical protein
LHSDSASYQNAINKIKEVKEINEEILNYIYSSAGIKWTEEEWNSFISLENKLEYLENKKFNLNYNQYELYLDSQDMYGNPYNFESFYK